MRNIFLIAVLFQICSSEAFVPKKILLEHFTNTYCSVCASRNPGLIANLNNQSETVYLRYHPSSPYPACTLNQTDKNGNDDRCKHYSLYGSTPRIAINGNPLSANLNYGSQALFTNYIGLVSSYKIKIDQLKTGSKISLRLTLKKVDSSVHMSGKLYLALCEDSIFFNAPNGENLHTSVFRKTLTATAGDALNLPENNGDSLVLFFNTSISNGFNIDRISAVAILTSASGEYLQSEKSKTQDKDESLSLTESKTSPHFKIYPNPAHSEITITPSLKEENYQIKFYDSNMREILMLSGNGEMTADISFLQAGLYFITISGSNGYNGNTILFKTD